MSKLGRSEIADHVRDNLVTYLRNGTINERQVAQALDITDLQIENIDRLKRIHFCLSDPVVEFVDKLQGRLRRIKTENQHERTITRGEIRGRIDWEDTIRHRYSDSIGDRSQFICETPYTEYNIPKNLVLKKLLWTVHSTVETDLSQIDYDWRTEQWSTELIHEFIRVFARNVHLNRIQDGEQIQLTPRMLNQTRSSRQTLYTRAYELYDRYERLLTNDDDPDIRKLLRDTLVIPERLPRLFELFCLFKVLEKLDSNGFRYGVIEPGAERFAQMDTDTQHVDVYHDRVGSLSFYVPLDEIEEVSGGYFERYRHTLERHNRLVDQFLDIESRTSLYSGRPDIIIEVYDTTTTSEILTDVVLGEIKYTSNEGTFSKGLKELIEYMEFAQSGDYLTGQDVRIHGIIITDGVVTELQSPEDGQITHLNAEDLLEDSTDAGWLPEALLDVFNTPRQIRI